ncbi:msx2-interacting protein-like [Eriocheir sinensis]|uniref:msx2-interacting protein-like n=1 Tax=Eriocheir sinensis TaxID=95602 RepID=UPI0021C5CE93|nr:msx2-interacting protein-like [Eriocheir sinensis]
MDAIHTLLLLLGWLAAPWQPSVNAQAWRSSPTEAPQGGERLDSQHSVIPLVKFSCRGRSEGYYGDMDFGCTVFHYCTGESQRFSFKCDEGMKFNEMTISCSAGYFGDCSHPDLVGSAGRNKSNAPITAHSFIKLPGFIKKAEEEGLGKSDHPLPFTQHKNPVRDINNNYFDSNDQEPDASNRVAKEKGNSIKRSSSSRTFESPMMSALSAFASLANIPLDSAMLAKSHREDRSRDVDHQDSFGEVDRAFLANPSPRRQPQHKQGSGSFFQLPFFQTETKKGRAVPHHPPPRAQSIVKTHHPRPHPRPDAQDPYVEPPPRYQRPPQRYPPGEDYDDPHDDRYDSVQSKTTTNSFRPSSLLHGGNNDDFRPVTEASRAPPALEDDELARPHREAQGGGAVSSTFQNFSPGFSQQGSAPRFPAHNTFNNPAQNTFNNPAQNTFNNPVQNTFNNPAQNTFNNPPQNTFNSPGQEAPTGFLSEPRFPSTGGGSFLFHRPPVPSLVTNAPFHHVLPSGTGFRPTPAPQLQPQGAFGFRPQPQPSHTGVRQPIPTFSGQPQSQAAPGFGQPSPQTFGRPPAPRPVQTFSFPQPRPPQSPPSIFGQGFTTQPSIFPQRLTPKPVSPQSPQSFGRPSNPPEPLNVFNLAAIPLHTTSDFGAPPPPPPGFSQSSDPVRNTFKISSPSSIVATTPTPLDDSGFGNTELQQESPLGQDDTQKEQPESNPTPARRPTRPSASRRRPLTGSSDTSRTPQSSSRLPDSSTDNIPSPPDNADASEAFGRPLQGRRRGRPRGRPEEGERQNTRRRPVSPSTEEPERLRPSRTRQPSQPLGPTLSRTTQEELPTQPGRRLPQAPRLHPHPVSTVTEDPFVLTTPFTPHTPDPFSRFPDTFNLQSEEHFQHSPDVFNLPTGVGGAPDSPQYLGNDLHPDLGFGSGPGDVEGEGLGAVEEVEEDTNVIQPAEADLSLVPDEASAAPSSPLPDTTTASTPLRRRPSMRTRLRSRPSLRTTTPPPDILHPEDTTQSDYDYSEDSVTTTEIPAIEDTLGTTTTLSPFRQRLQDRLDRLKNRRRQNYASHTTTRTLTSSRRTTTQQPTTNQRGADRFAASQRDSDDEADADQPVTTVSPRRRLLRPSGLDRNKFQSFRNKLRSRIRSRVTTSETSETEEDTTVVPETTEEEEAPSGGRARRLNRFKPRPTESHREGVLVVKEILRSPDQETQETTRLEVSEKTTLEHNRDHPDGGDASATTEVFGGRKGDKRNPIDLQEDGEEGHTEPPEPEASAGPGFQGRRIVDPNFRARFRQFLKNRKNKLSARYRASGGTDEESEGQEDVADAEEGQRLGVLRRPYSRPGAEGESHSQDNIGPAQGPQQQQQQQEEEELSAVLKERAEKFEQRRKELRDKLLARGDDGRLSRRIPALPFRDNVPEGVSTKDEEQLLPGGEKSAPTSEAPQAPDEEMKTTESPVQKVISIDGFRPIIETPPAPPTPTHPKPQQEPEVITAPPANEDDDVMMLFKVSAGFGGRKQQQQQKDVTRPSLSDLPPPSTMIVREIGAKPSTSPAPPPVTPGATTPVVPLESDDAIEDDPEDPHEVMESQHAPVLLSVQTVPERASLDDHEGLVLTPATTRTTEPPPPPPPSPSSPAEAEATSSPVPPRAGRPSRPSFNLAAASDRRGGPDNEGEAATGGAAVAPATPPPHLTITMATDSPFLPLEMLLPLSSSR